MWELDGETYYEEDEHKALCSFVRWNSRHPARSACNRPALHVIGDRNWSNFGVCDMHWIEVRNAMSLEVIQGGEFGLEARKIAITTLVNEPEAEVAQARAEISAHRREHVDHLYRQAGSMYIYFIQAGDDGPIKIGYTTDLRKRFESLQVANASVLHVRAIVAGDASLEYAYHQLFWRHRLNGEWFSPVPEILDEIEKINEGAPALPAVPASLF